MQAPAPPTAKRKKRRFQAFNSAALGMSSPPSSSSSSAYMMSNRNQGGRQKRHKSQNMRAAQVALRNYQLMSLCCFTNNQVQLADTMNAATMYHDMNKNQRKKWLRDKCTSVTSKRKGFAVRTSNHSSIVRCCSQCFAHYHGFSRSTITRAQKKISQGEQMIPEEVKENNSLKKHETHAWVTDIYLHFGDYMPDEETVCLPVYSKRELYDWYASSEEMFAQYEHREFCKLMEKEFPFITFRKCKKFMQCDWCNKMDIKIAKTKV